MKGLLAAALLLPLRALAEDLPLPGFTDSFQPPARSTAAAPAASGAAPAAVAVSTMSPEEALVADTRRHLKALIALDTSNPPGNEIIAADYLKKQLDAEGIPSQIYASSGTRASLIARLKGSGAKRPLLLMCHTDVVPADKAGWSTDPFAPTEKEGYLYGRGAADIKCMCAAELSVMSYLKRTSAPLDRDVIFFAEADEESGDQDRPIDAVIREHGADLDAEMGINEGGNTIWDGAKVTEMRVETAEKQYMDLTLVARGQAGHASVPREGNAVVALSRAVTRLAEYRPAAVSTGVVREFLQKQEETAQAPLRTALDDVLKAQPGPDLERAADNLALASPEFGAMLRDTVVPTMLSAGYKSNVIPAEATAVVNVRLLPGEKADDFAAGLKKAIDDPNVEVRFAPPARSSSEPMSTETDLYRAAQAQMKERAPQARVLPFLAAWTTDSQELRAKGVTMYGIDPPLTGEDGERVHGNNERISLDGLDWYSKFLRGLVVKTAGVQASAMPVSRVPDPTPAASQAPAQAQAPKN